MDEAESLETFVVENNVGELFVACSWASVENGPEVSVVALGEFVPTHPSITITRDVFDEMSTWIGVEVQPLAKYLSSRMPTVDAEREEANAGLVAEIAQQLVEGHVTSNRLEAWTSANLSYEFVSMLSSGMPIMELRDLILARAMQIMQFQQMFSRIAGGEIVTSDRDLLRNLLRIP